MLQSEMHGIVHAEQVVSRVISAPTVETDELKGWFLLFGIVVVGQTELQVISALTVEIREVISDEEKQD